MHIHYATLLLEIETISYIWFINMITTSHAMSTLAYIIQEQDNISFSN